MMKRRFERVRGERVLNRQKQRLTERKMRVEGTEESQPE
jgi:hypothetical protein